MKKLMTWSVVTFTLLLSFSFSILPIPSQPAAIAYEDGDILFISSSSGQGKAIQLATKSKYTHVGIVFKEKGEYMVYHAVEPVMKSSLKEFTAFSNDGKVTVRRLKDRSVLTPEVIANMLKDANLQLGKHYDLAFNWSDTELYCSEYVWKLYYHATKLQVGALKPLKSFDLSHPIVKKKLEERYGNTIPYDEKMISPGDLYDSSLLVSVPE